jgi:hypothetical protein
MAEACSCRRLSRILLTVSLIVYILCVFIFAPWSSSENKTHRMTSFETIVVDVDTRWYDTVEVGLQGAQSRQDVVVSLHAKMPRATAAERSEIISLRLVANSYTFYSLSLRQGARVGVGYAASQTLNVLLIQGFDNFNRWRDGAVPDLAVMPGLLYNGVGDSLEPPASLEAPETGAYFFVWEFSPGVQSPLVRAEGNASLHFDVALYNASRALSTCTHRQRCALSLARGSDEVVLISSGGGGGGGGVDVGSAPTTSLDAVAVTVDGRFDFYFGVFLGAVVGSLVAIAALIYAGAAWQRRRKQRASYLNF